MSNAAAYDAPNTDPVDRLPQLSPGTYKLLVNKAEYKPFNELLILEVTPTEAKGASEVGESYVWFINMGIKSKMHGVYVARRVKSFVYAALSRNAMTGADIEKATTETPEMFVGKEVYATVRETTDEDGNVRTSKTGNPLLEATFTAA